MDREQRHKRIRTKIYGTTEKPRLSVRKSLKHIYCQLIDDTKQNTLAFASSSKISNGKKTEKSKECGKLIAKMGVEKGIKKVVFDRSGYRYHGRVRALAEGAREGGLEF